jgi:type I restriction enzyme, R subunit
MDLGGRLTTPEQLARHNIDRMLELAGWSVQDMKGVDFTASRGVALREFPLKAEFADYMLFVDRQAVGIVEAKKEGTTLGGVDTQSKKYQAGPPGLRYPLQCRRPA